MAERILGNSGVFIEPTSGGQVLLPDGGVYDSPPQNTWIAVGGVSFSGASLTQKWPKEYTASGGAIVAGVSSFVRYKSYTFVGGVSVSGTVTTSATNKAVQTYLPSDGVIVSGTSPELMCYIAIYIPEGGVVVSGFNDVYVPGYVVFNGTSSQMLAMVPNSNEVESKKCIAFDYFEDGSVPPYKIQTVRQVLYRDCSDTSFGIGSYPKKFTLGFEFILSPAWDVTPADGILLDLYEDDSSEYNSSPDVEFFLALEKSNGNEGFFIYAQNTSGSFQWENTSSSLPTGIRHRLVVQVDTAQATDSDRLKVWLNGVQLTPTSVTWPTQNYVVYNDPDFLNPTYQQVTVGGMLSTPYPYTSMSGYFLRVYFIDGSVVSSDALFGSTNYSGDYGAGGFLLAGNSLVSPGYDSGPLDNSLVDYSILDGWYYTINTSTVEYPYSPALATTKFTFSTEVYVPSSVSTNWDTIFDLCNGNYFAGTVGICFNENTKQLNAYMYTEDWVLLVDVYTQETVITDTWVKVTLYYDSTQAVDTDRVSVFLDDTETTFQSNPVLPSQGTTIWGGDTRTWYQYFVLGGISGNGYADYRYEGRLRNTLYIDGIIVNSEELTPDYSGPYGTNGWHLKYNDPEAIGRDYSGNDIEFSYVDLQHVYTYEPIVSSGFGITLELVVDTSSMVIGMQLYLYSGEEVTPTLQLEILVGGSDIILPMKLYGSGDVVSISLPLKLYNSEEVVGGGTDPAYVRWYVGLFIDSVDMSSKFVGSAEVEQEEDASAIATFAIAPSTGAVDPLLYVGKAVELWWNHYDMTGALVYSRRKFSGWVADVEWDADRRLISITADTQLPAQFNAMSKEEIAALVGGTHSENVWDNVDDKSGWTYAQERLSTTYNCVWQDENRVIRVTPLLANRVDMEDVTSAIVPHYTFTDAERFHETLSLTYAQRSEMVNTVKVGLTYSYQRKRHRELTFKWLDNSDACSFLKWPGNWQLCQRSMVDSAASSGTWKAISPIVYTPVWDAGCYNCGGGMYDWVCWNITTVSGFVNGEEKTVDPVTGEETQNEGFAYDSIVDASFLCNGASWRAAARWLQDVDEIYDLVVQSPESVTAVGPVVSTEEYGLRNEVDSSDWANSIIPFDTDIPAGSKTISGAGDLYWDVDEEDIEDSVSRTEFEETQKVILAAAKGDIVRAHRLNSVSFKVAFQPDLNLSHTVKVDTPYLVAAGKVKMIRDVLDSESGEASTEITLAISRHNGSGNATEDTPIASVDKPEPTEEPSISSVVRLGTYKGGRESSAIYDIEAQETWEGFLTNYLSSLVAPDWSANPVENPIIAARTYPYSFVVRGPEIDETHTKAVSVSETATYNVAVPKDTLEIYA
jgi:hypothetical protein